jgi:hypothetical protein
MISCAPTPFMRSWNPSARDLTSPSIRNRGAELGTTRTCQPSPLETEPVLRMAKTSGGVQASLVSQNGQNPVCLTNLLK